MDTVRVNICYRPVRIAWAIESNDKDSFRRAVMLSHTMWGGPYNPIILVDRAEADQLVQLYRADVIVPLGQSERVKEYPKRFPHLIDFLHSGLFAQGSTDLRAQLLDIHNALIVWRDTPAWKATVEKGFRRYVWQPDDPLSDVFLIQYGAFPAPGETGVDYLKLVQDAARAPDFKIEKGASLSAEMLDHPSLSFLSRRALDRHHILGSGGWSFPGFYVGDSDSVDDLACFWNLRAADLGLLFIDPKHHERQAQLVSEHRRRLESDSKLMLPVRGDGSGA
jgi:hypothetical protein